jgi:hypothetical protein
MLMQQSWRLELGANHRLQATPAVAGGIGTGRPQDKDKDRDPAIGRRDDPTRPGAGQQGTLSGVYIISPEYLCIALDTHPMGQPGGIGRPGAPGAEGARPGAGAGQQPGAAAEQRPGTAIGGAPGQHHNQFVLILRKQGAGTGQPPRQP